MEDIIRIIVFLFVLGSIFHGCLLPSENPIEPLFEELPASLTNIHFSNNLTFSDSLNVFTYADFYGGGGVALGDINNDGLLDIYLVANQGKNRLYLNKKDFEFEDITDRAGVSGSKSWSTGVSMADVNGDGLLDIYVSNSASPSKDRQNELFINNGDLTFTERASDFGIADSGFTIHASFFDYDKDGDLDLYILNNRNSKPIGRYDLSQNIRNVPNYNGGDRLYRNDDGLFTDVTKEAGIHSSEIGFGLGVSVGDLDRDGWMDIYISNDFFERDYLYMNNGDGTFRDVLEEKFNSISTASMGSDIGDLNNDGYPELYVTDMLPEDEERLKKITAFISWEQYQSEVAMGYHRKFTRNTLQFNNQNGTFSEIGRYAGVEATDWSWGALMADFNLNGRKDIFVANGIFKDETDKDFLIATTRRDVIDAISVNDQVDNSMLLDLMPSTPVSNYLFENMGRMKFVNRAQEWGLGRPGFSNGAAYGDLNGDGSLDLVINNVNMEVSIYRNRVKELHPDRKWIQVELEGLRPNRFGVGAQVELKSGDRYWYAEQILQRGFQSSVDPVLHIGLGPGVTVVDTLQVFWPDGRLSRLTHLKTEQKVLVRQSEALSERISDGNSFFTQNGAKEKQMLGDVTKETGVDWSHQESFFNDFDRFPLSYHMRSTEGPPICIGDINDNGYTDFYVGGARGHSGALFLQNSDGEFVENIQPILESHKEHEDTDCTFLDIDRDGVLELYVASGSSEFPAGNALLADRMYRFDVTEDSLRYMPNVLPNVADGEKPTGVVRSVDVDGDGYPDLFTGERMFPFAYGIPVGGRLLMNDGTGIFEDATPELAPGLLSEEIKSVGITDAVWGDLNGDGSPDLLIAGEWMPLTLFFNYEGKLERAELEKTGLSDTYGWWRSLALADLNGDGSLDLVGGNYGLNSQFKPTSERPVHMWAGNFGRLGLVDQIYAIHARREDELHSMALLHDLLSNIPVLRAKYDSYGDYAGQRMYDVFTRRELNEKHHYQVSRLASVVGWNNGEGVFQVESLPFSAQLAPIYSILPHDLDGDDIPELIMGGNLLGVQPQVGSFDAGYGTVLRLNETGSYIEVPSSESGLSLSGEIRSIQSITLQNGDVFFLISRSNEPLRIFRLDQQR